MLMRLLADFVVLVHGLFVAFIVVGGLLALRWPKMALVHLPAAVYGVAIEWVGWICPLTPLENTLRRQAGAEGYRGGFVEHHVLPLLYPAELTRSLQWKLGAAVLVINVVVYAGVILRIRKRHHRRRLQTSPWQSD